MVKINFQLILIFIICNINQSMSLDSYDFLNSKLRLLSTWIYDDARKDPVENINNNEILYLDDKYLKSFFDEINPKINFSYVLIIKNNNNQLERYLDKIDDQKIIEIFINNFKITHNKIKNIKIDDDFNKISENIILTSFIKNFNKKIKQKIKFTYGFSGGRLGDNLISFIRARWLAYVYNGEVVLKNFKFIENFQFFKNHNDVDNSTPVSQLTNLKEIEQKKDNKSIIFEIPYFPFENLEKQLYWQKNRLSEIFKINWLDKNFINILKKEIVSNSKFNLKLTKSFKYNVAMHYRFGSGPDLVQDEPIPIPSKSPSIDYYINALGVLKNILNNGEIYCHIFSDKTNIENFLNILKKEFPQINFGCHVSNQDIGVLEDFFSMLDFEYMIRPCSNISLIASIIGKCHTVIMPISQNQNIIDKLGFYSDIHDYNQNDVLKIPTKVGFGW